MLFCAIEGDPSSFCRFFNPVNRKCMKFKKLLRIKQDAFKRNIVILCRDCEKYKETNP